MRNQNLLKMYRLVVCILTGRATPPFGPKIRFDAGRVEEGEAKVVMVLFCYVLQLRTVAT